MSRRGWRTVLADLDPAVDNGSLSMAGAVTTYLSFRRDELHADPDHLMRLAARAEWEGDPPIGRPGLAGGAGNPALVAKG